MKVAVLYVELKGQSWNWMSEEHGGKKLNESKVLHQSGISGQDPAKPWWSEWVRIINCMWEWSGSKCCIWNSVSRDAAGMGKAGYQPIIILWMYNYNFGNSMPNFAHSVSFLFEFQLNLKVICFKFVYAALLNFGFSCFSVLFACHLLLPLI